MGAAPSTPRLGAAGAAPSPSAAEQMFTALVGEKAYPISSEFWKQLLELPLTLQWPRDRVLQACHAFGEYHPSRSTSNLRKFRGCADCFLVLSRQMFLLPPSFECFDLWGNADHDHVVCVAGDRRLHRAVGSRL
jgi:dymeclin